MPVFNRISNKISVAVLAPLALLITGLSVGTYLYVVSVLKQEIELQQAAMMTLVAGQIETTVSQSQQLLQIVANAISPSLIADVSVQQRYLDAENDSRYFFNGGFILIDRNGRIILESPDRGNRGKDRSFRDYVRIPLQTGKAAISSPYLAMVVPQTPTITFSVPIKDKSGKVVGVLAGRHDLATDVELSNLAKISIGRGGYLYLLDYRRTLIMHRDRSRIMEQVQPGKNPGLDKAISGFEGTLENVNSKGVAGLTTFRRLKNVPWIVASHIPLDEAYAPIKRARVFFALTFVLILGLSWFMVVVATRRVTSPIDHFIGHIRAIASGDKRQRTVELATGDEIETLAEAFNDMVLELDRRQDSLRESQEIYRTIAEFTSEIAILKDEKSNVRYISPNCEAIIGYRDKEFIADPGLIERIIHEDDRSIWKNHMHIHDEKGYCSHLDLRIVCRNGEVRWFSHVCHPIYNANGEITGIRGGFRDISQRILMEERIDSQRRFLEKIMESTSTPLFVIGRDHRLIAWNRALETLTGYLRDEMIGTDRQWEPFYPVKRPTLADLILEGRTDQLEEYYDSFTTGDRINGMFRSEGWYDINSCRRYLLFEASPVTGDDGEVVAVVETFHDLTNRKDTEERLTLFSQAVDQSASSIVITDPDGTIEYVNEKFCKVSGYTREEAVGKNPRILKSGLQGDDLYRDLWATIRSGSPWHGEFANKDKMGKLYWELVTIAPILDDFGEIRHFLAVKDDITARKESERKLRKHQAELEVKHEELRRLYNLVEQVKMEWESSMDCIDDILIIADRLGTIRRCNRAFAEFTGRDYGALLGEIWWDFIVCEDVEHGELRGNSGELFHKPSSRWFFLRSYPYGDPAKGDVIITLHDMTGIKIMTDELKKAYDDLKTTHLQLLQQEKMASIGQLAAGVAHEINNPMGFIGSNLATMGKYLGRLNEFISVQGEAIDTSVPHDSRERIVAERRRLKVDYVIEDIPKLLQESLDGAERVKTIVQNLKSFSRVDESEQKAANINECLESTISIAWNELKYKVTLEKDFGELPLVVCHPQQVNQVFLNLLVNAAHAIDKQGLVKVRTWHEAGEVNVAISDTGCGIPGENLTRIFEPFFTTKEVGKGTGLGLSISYDIIKKHGGEITVSSELGVGTTFTVHLPVGGGVK